MYHNLSRPQEAIYYMSRLSEDSIANIAGDVFFNFNVSLKEVKEAILDFLDKCDIMHTRIKYINGEPMQKIDRDYIYSDIPVLSFNNYYEYSFWAKKEVLIPIKITDRLYKIFIIDIAGKIGLFSVIHHLISDATSFAYIGKYVTRYLKGERNIAIYSYSEYLDSEKKYESTKRYVQDSLYWLEEFKSCKINYYSDKKAKDRHASRRNFALDKKTSNRIKRFCKKHNITEYVLLFSILAIEYFKITQKNEFFIGTPILNRYNIREENMLGVFVNTVPIGFCVNNNDSFLGFCVQVTDKVLSAFRHQKYHYTQLLKDISRQFETNERMFDVLFSFWNVKIHDQSTANWFSCCNQMESLQIHIDDRKSEDIYHINYDYQTEKFTEKDIECLHSHVCSLLDEVLQNPEKRICDLKMLSNEENNKLLYEYNDTAHTYSVPESSTIYSLFERAAKQNPDKICIKIAEKTITFRELINFSEKLDTKIRGMTECKKSIVAVIAERSVEMYAGIYGIIRGGNAYLPIDPDYPEERINYMLENSDAAVVVVQEKFAHLVKKTRCINITEFINKFNEEDSIIPDCAAKADDTAYVIYTSGSTGNPKGVKVSHKSAVNRILWMQDKYPLKDNGVILQKTPYTFDVSVWELFWWGMCGGKLAVSRPGEHFLPAKILDETYSNKVTHLHFVPSVFKLFLNYLEEHKDELYKFNSVRYVFLSGEVLTASLIERFYKLYDYNKVTLHNLYGPTECAVDVTYYDCAPDDADPVPIGKPIYNTQMYVVDRYMNATPNGVKGELCIAGANVGQGYLNNPELTAEKFIDNPFGEGKLYKTGDLAYWRDDGQIIFCGRMDGQIKLNGQRIEIGEIESVISCIDCIDSAAVIIKNVNARDMLVAFYTGKEGSESIIKETCSVKLPKYMVPSIVVHLDKLPLNHSGKLDRKILSQIETEFKRNDENESPINELERFICEAFEKILCRQNISRNSDFFDIGGTSLSMISLLSEKGFEDITAAEFMRNPTPVGLALVMNDKKIIKLKYLEPLYLADKTKQVLILLPFAGGGVEAYSNFVNSFKNINENTSVYFIRYLHSTDECRKAAEEISDTIKNTEIILYSHCVGSAVALQILSFLERTEISVKHYFAGASIPPAKPTKKNIWNIVPDKALKSILMKSGAKLNELSDEKISELFRQFRKDTDFANISFYEFNTKIKVPVTVIINKKDIFTLNYRQAEKLWGNFAEAINEVRFIDSESHYFQSENSEALANILNNPRFIH